MSEQAKPHGANKKYKRGIAFGAWDMFHIGHLNLLEKAKKQCEILIVCINTDQYVKKIKKVEPVISFIDRGKIVQALKCVDITSIQGAYTFSKKQIIRNYKPDVIFVGDDWKGKDWDGAKLGIPVVYLPYTKGISSTMLRKKL